MNPPNVPGPSNLPPDSTQSPPPYTPPPGGTPPPMRPAGGGGLFSGRNIVIGLIALALLCACTCGVIFFVVLPRVGSNIATQLQTAAPGGLETVQVAAVGTDFMTRLKNSDWNGAYNLCTPDLKKELGSAPQLGTKISGGKVQPVDWTFQDFSTITPTSQDAQIDGTAHFSGNRSGTLRLVLDRVAPNQWQISGFNLQPQ